MNSVSDRFITYSYKNLAMVVVMGDVPRTLQEARNRIDWKYRHPNIELSPVKYQEGMRRDILGIFMTKPSKDITIDQTGEESGIVGFSLDRPSLIKSMAEFARFLDFTPKPPTLENMRAWDAGFKVERVGYDYCEMASSISKIPLENFWGAARYINFLKAYKGVPEREAKNRATLKFNLGIQF